MDSHRSSVHDHPRVAASTAGTERVAGCQRAEQEHLCGWKKRLPSLLQTSHDATGGAQPRDAGWG